MAQLDSGAGARFGVDVQRARLLAGGLLILEAVSELFEAPLELGRGGLREGLLLDARLPVNAAHQPGEQRLLG